MFFFKKNLKKIRASRGSMTALYNTNRGFSLPRP